MYHSNEDRVSLLYQSDEARVSLLYRSDEERVSQCVGRLPTHAATAQYIPDGKHSATQWASLSFFYQYITILCKMLKDAGRPGQNQTLMDQT